jgi:hypothetical protein
VIVGDPSDAERISTNHVKKQPNFTTTVRARPGRLSALSVLHSKSSFYGAFVWARRALNCTFRRVPARAVLRLRHLDHGRRPLEEAARPPGRGVPPALLAHEGTISEH